MTNKKNDPVAIEVVTRVCPVCRKNSYSKDGIHPQCAALKADEPRRLALIAEKKAKEIQANLEKS